MWIRQEDIVFGFSMGFPVRQAGRHHMAIQKKSIRMVKKERIPEDLTKEFSVHSTSNFSLLAGFKSEVHLSVCNADNEEVKNE